MMMSRMTWRSFVAAIGACLLALQALHGCDGSFKAEIGREAPNFHYSKLDGTRSSLRESRGKMVLLRFWADWCPPCATEFPIIERVYREMNGKGLEVIAVNVRQSEDRVRAYTGRFDLSHTIALDSDGKISKRYGVKGLPLNFIIDKNGIIKEMIVGAISDGSMLKQYLTPHF